jgi:hypothetical protein
MDHQRTALVLALGGVILVQALLGSGASAKTPLWQQRFDQRRQELWRQDRSHVLEQNQLRQQQREQQLALVRQSQTEAQLTHVEIRTNLTARLNQLFSRMRSMASHFTSPWSFDGGFGRFIRRQGAYIRDSWEKGSVQMVARLRPAGKLSNAPPGKIGRPATVAPRAKRRRN